MYSLFGSGLRGMLVSWLLLDATTAAILYDSRSIKESYDYIVIGGGTSGLVVANRLSEDPNKSVLVLEHGYINDSPNTKIPRAVAKFPNLGIDTWNVTSAPLENVGNIRTTVQMADVVGGGSVINGMFADRGARADYDAWEELGNEGWGFDGLLPYFRKSSTLTPPSPEHVSEYGIQTDPAGYTDGPLQVGFPTTMFPDLKNMTAALNAHGVGTSRDPATGEPSGSFGRPTPSTRVPRPNLHLVTGHTVNKILFDDDLAATGVSVTPRPNSDGGGVDIAFNISATQEVILAAGAISTPKLLQLSGVGPRAVLEAAGVPLRLDLPSVGANFQDHPQVMASWNLTGGLAFPNPGTLASNATYNASAWDEYEAHGTGPYTVAFSNTAAFLPLRNFTTSASYAAIMESVAVSEEEMKGLPGVYHSSPELLAGYRAQRAILRRHLGGLDAAAIEFPFTAAGFGTSGLNKPLSRGTVTLAPSTGAINNTITRSGGGISPAEAAPIVQYQAFAHPADRAVVLASVRWIRDLYRTSSLLARYGPVEVAPGATAQTDEAMWDALVSGGCGTCAMMPPALGGCVGADMLVHGTRRLAVVDASVMPLIPGTHLQATVYAVAEKAADIIKARSQ
ncbi:choline dehydrogenase-like protein [Apiospora rasikravindrae]|uniref:Choline dehydrogenase-like protein n=1 Tax=Apiospora rasikravindrae TaxID=990691 RepID=A0ABR1U0L3_9PEZI